MVSTPVDLRRVEAALQGDEGDRAYKHPMEAASILSNVTFSLLTPNVRKWAKSQIVLFCVVLFLFISIYAY
jgi:hypothetical protein